VFKIVSLDKETILPNKRTKQVLTKWFKVILRVNSVNLRAEWRKHNFKMFSDTMARIICNENLTKVFKFYLFSEFDIYSEIRKDSQDTWVLNYLKKSNFLTHFMFVNIIPEI